MNVLEFDHIATIIHNKVEGSGRDSFNIRVHMSDKDILASGRAYAIEFGIGLTIDVDGRLVFCPASQIVAIRFL